jgi:hypothetical protein
MDRRQNEIEIDKPPRLWAGIVVCALLIVLMTIVRLHTFGGIVLPVGYGVPLVIAAYFRNRKLLWVTAIVFAALTIIKFFLMEPQIQPHYMTASPADWTAGAVVLIDLLLVSWIGDIWIRTSNANTQQTAELRQINSDLATHEEEIARQNEELQSQTEELERQSEELRVTNEELARREKMLESLLLLSRSLTADLPIDETKSRICQTLSELVDHQTTAAAILERQGDELVVRCYVGCDGGVVRDRIPYKNSFASLIMERGRT